jgi:hypothetical protein
MIRVADDSRPCSSKKKVLRMPVSLLVASFMQDADAVLLERTSISVCEPILGDMPEWWQLRLNFEAVTMTPAQAGAATAADSEDFG